MYPRVPAAKAMCTIGVKLPTRPMYLACIYCCSVAYVHPRASTQVCTGPYTMWHIVTSVQPSERGWDKQLVKVRTRKRTPMTGCTEEEDVFQYLFIYLSCQAQNGQHAQIRLLIPLHNIIAYTTVGCQVREENNQVHGGWSRSDATRHFPTLTCRPIRINNPSPQN